MNKLTTRKLLQRILGAFLVLFLYVQVNAQSYTFKPKDPQLYQTIARMDSLMFDAFNRRDLRALQDFFANNVEFYNDGGGLTTYEQTMRNFKTLFESNTTSGLHRELVPGSLEVYPMPGFGAIEVGIHRFIHTENGKEEVGVQKFIHVWQLSNGKWQATRVISLGH
ncbi:nuclear transport factor 2 family protein [Mucilaginibacter sp. RS28]|uniref:Nuclear transport factor 2 family protein n=1 Tax=Mucilaginibacter straminoryzae TaxID=2932774 RepID=A0A9X1X556_9SPHI|nr:nuclear transport factor 2 family protein [Mucilaginibacter straminoryzae]MCJ8209773.1 nuclear transport factor 2 family protein [Mucilaginibacter straminoryzae]